MGDPQAPVTPEFVPVTRADVVSVELDGEMVLYDDATNRLHHLNSTASVLWSCLDGSGTVAEIAVDIADVYGAEPGDVLADVLPIIRRFLLEGLLEEGAGTEPPAGEASSTTSSGLPERSSETRFLEEPGAECLDSKFLLGAKGQITVEVGGLLLGLRLSTSALAEAARAVLAPSMVAEPTAPANVSIIEARAGAGCPIYFCYRGGWLLARARSVGGAIDAAVRLLSSYADPTMLGATSPSPVRIEAVASFKDGTATLLARESRWGLPALVPRLRAAGFSTLEEPWVLLDPSTGNAVLHRSAFPIDDDVLNGLPLHHSDRSRPPAGSYPVDRWVAFIKPGEDPPEGAARLIGVAADSPDLGRDTAAVLHAVGAMLRRAAWTAVSAFDAVTMARAVGA